MKKVVRLAKSDADKIEQAAAFLGLTFQAFAASVLIYVADVTLSGVDKEAANLNENESEIQHD